MYCAHARRFWVNTGGWKKWGISVRMKITNYDFSRSSEEDITRSTIKHGILFVACYGLSWVGECEDFYEQYDAWSEFVSFLFIAIGWYASTFYIGFKIVQSCPQWLRLPQRLWYTIYSESGEHVIYFKEKDHGVLTHSRMFIFFIKFTDYSFLISFVVYILLGTNRSSIDERTYSIYCACRNENKIMIFEIVGFSINQSVLETIKRQNSL